MLPRFNKDNFPKVLKLVSGLQTIATAHKATPAQIAIAWIAAQSESLGVRIVVIPGAKQPKYVEENLGADKIKLSEDELTRIRVLADESDWAKGGAREPAFVEHFGNIDTPPFKE